MIIATEFKVKLSLLNQALNDITSDFFRISINEPCGDFFYDSWKLKDEYVGTVWETIYNSLPVIKGEARLIQLKYGTCYQSHSDIDDRYHLNLVSENCYLIDLESERIHKIEQDGIWYEMNAGKLHSAANFGRPNRYQLVIRKLLNRNKLKNSITIKVSSQNLSIDDSRFLFDQTASSWLNKANKSGTITNFKVKNNTVIFDIEKDLLNDFSKTLSSDFDITTI